MKAQVETRKKCVVVVVGLLTALLGGCAHESGSGDGALSNRLATETSEDEGARPRARRPDSFGINGDCAIRPSTTQPVPAPAEEDGGARWTPSTREHWTNALAGYHGAVTALNQVAIGRERGVFVNYLVGVHNKIHPIFTDSYLEWLTSLPPADPRNDLSRTTLVELVIEQDGTISNLGVVCSSGNEDFDIGVLDAVTQAAPFGTPARVTLSSDDKLYVRWWFSRHPVMGCSTINARAFRLALDAPPDAGAPGAP